MHFEYILEFLRIVEERIRSGILLLPDMPIDPLKSFSDNMKDLQKEMEKSKSKLKELQQILGRIGSLRLGHGGDIFFKSLAKTFQTNPIIPAVHKWAKDLH